MRQVYRVAGADLDLDLAAGRHHAQPLASGRSRARRRPISSSSASRCRATRPCSTGTNRLFPRAQDPEAAAGGERLVHRLPPPQAVRRPEPASRPAETSDSLYRTPLYLLLSARAHRPSSRCGSGTMPRGGRRPFDFNLNALQIRDGSEQLFVGGRKLVRGVDYSISYDVGQVTFLNPDELFGQGTGQVHGALRGARDLRGGPDDHPRHVHPLLAGRSGLDQPDRALSAGAERLHSPGPRVRGHGQPDRGGQHPAAVPPRGSPDSSTASPPARRPRHPSWTSMPSSPSASRTPTARARRTWRSSSREAGLQIPMREAEWEFGSAPQQADGPGGHRVLRRVRPRRRGRS